MTSGSAAADGKGDSSALAAGLSSASQAVSQGWVVPLAWACAVGVGWHTGTPS